MLAYKCGLARAVPVAVSEDIMPVRAATVSCNHIIIIIISLGRETSFAPCLTVTAYHVIAGFEETGAARYIRRRRQRGTTLHKITENVAVTPPVLANGRMIVSALRTGPYLDVKPTSPGSILSGRVSGPLCAG